MLSPIEQSQVSFTDSTEEQATIKQMICNHYQLETVTFVCYTSNTYVEEQGQ